MIYHYLLLSGQNSNSFVFPLSQEHIEDYESMTLNQRINYAKETIEETTIDKVVAVVNDGTLIEDGIYFLDKQYKSAYFNLSDYEKSIFKAYIQNVRFDFKEFSDVMDNYKNPDIDRINAHTDSIQNFLNLVDMDDEPKARIFDKAERFIKTDSVKFLCERDAKIFDSLGEMQRIQLFNSYKLKDFDTEKQKVFAEYRKSSIEMDLNDGDTDLFFDYYDKGVIDKKEYWPLLVKYSYNYLDIIDTIPMTPEELSVITESSTSSYIWDNIENISVDKIHAYTKYWHDKGVIGKSHFIIGIMQLYKQEPLEFAIDLTNQYYDFNEIDYSSIIFNDIQTKLERFFHVLKFDYNFDLNKSFLAVTSKANIFLNKNVLGNMPDFLPKLLDAESYAHYKNLSCTYIAEKEGRDLKKVEAEYDKYIAKLFVDIEKQYNATLEPIFKSIEEKEMLNTLISDIKTVKSNKL